MAYEYENTVVAELTSLGMQYNSNAHYEMADEVEEVYAKAEAFNEIVNLLKASHSDYAEDILEDIDVIVMDYRED
ncbi:hypothetical protein [Mammaliicoccus sciuri]|uniref:hypothetical protein n=1 Tax=Mammaliicoccus sciuri TaxID=1296 RepID=UPI003F55F6E7